jgi:integrase
VTFRGTIGEARKELRRLIGSVDTGEHVAPDRTTLADWVAEWLVLRGREVTVGTAEHYAELLRVHVIPTLGNRRLQDIKVGQIDRLYGELALHLSARSVRHVHVVLKSCLKTAVNKQRLADNPAARATTHKPKDSTAWNVLDPDQLKALVRGFKDTAMYGIVCVAAFTGMRRNEILALRWEDIDFAKSTIKVVQAVQKTKQSGPGFKGPKTDLGKRTIEIDPALLGLLRAEHARHLRLMVGIPDGVEVDTSLVRLPPGALVFPSLATLFDFTRPRTPTTTTKEFTKRAAALGFPIRLHDLRHSHATILLSKGMPVHDVAARLGHDAAMLLKVYAHRLPKADKRAADIMGAIATGL